jgi:hypothetical protein
MERSMTKKNLICLAFTFLLSSHSIDAFAQTGDSNMLKSIRNYIRDLPTLVKTSVNPVMEFYTKLLFAKVPELSQTISTHIAISKTQKEIDTLPLEPNSSDITPVSAQYSPNPVGLNIGGGFTNTFKDLNAMYAGTGYPSASNITPQSYNYYKLTPSNLGGSVNQTVFSLSPENVFSNKPLNTPKAKIGAKLFIAYAAGVGLSKQGVPTTSASFLGAQKAKTLEYYTMQAISNFSNYVLSEIYADNAVSKTLTSSSVLGFPTNKPITLNALTAYLDNSKALNADWYKKMAVASPYAVQREALYLVAGQTLAMHKAEKTNEKILAAIVMQNTILLSVQKSLSELNSVISMAKKSAGAPPVSPQQYNTNLEAAIRRAKQQQSQGGSSGQGQ